ncbi:MAG TPA: ABC transporter substrate-binding protein [Micromonosporaceae bacterium]
MPRSTSRSAAVRRAVPVLRAPWRAVPALLAALLVVAGCAAPNRASASSDKVRLVIPTTAISWLLPGVARQTGAFGRHGLSVQLTVAGSGPLAVQAVTSGSADVGLDVLNLTLQAAGQGRDLVNFGKVFNQWDGQLVVSEKVARQRGLSSGSDPGAVFGGLKGLTLAVVGPGTGDDALLRAELRDAGLTPDKDVRITPIKDTQATVAALSTGRIDGFLRASPVPQLALRRGGATTLFDFGANDTQGLFAGVLFADRRWLSTHRDTAKRLVAALSEAAAFVRSHPEQGADAVRSAYTGLPDEVFGQALASALRLADDHVAAISEQDFRTNLRYVQPASAAGGLRYDRVVDNSLL